jgi:hypothetical protein
VPPVPTACTVAHWPEQLSVMNVTATLLSAM